MYTQNVFRNKASKLRNLAVLAVVTTLISAGCSSQQPAAAPSTPGASGTQQALNNPNAQNDLQQQAAHQQLLGQMQAQAMEQAHEHELASGKAK